MTSAYASPPPLRFGSADLKANARRFLERALVISALAHLAAVGVFRAALDRFAAQEEDVPTVIGHWEDSTFITPPIAPIPRNWRPPGGTPSTQGAFVPVGNLVLDFIDRGRRDVQQSPISADPGRGADAPTPRDGSVQHPEAQPGFSYFDTPPEPIVAPQPAYPAWAREAGIEGKVLVRVLVGTDGVPKKMVVVRGPKGLTEGLEVAILRWRFRPGLANKQPVEVWVEIPITFRLTGD